MSTVLQTHQEGCFVSSDGIGNRETCVHTSEISMFWTNSLLQVIFPV